MSPRSVEPERAEIDSNFVQNGQKREISQKGQVYNIHERRAEHPTERKENSLHKSVRLLPERAVPDVGVTGEL